MWELRVERKDVSGKEFPEREFSLSYEVGQRGVSQEITKKRSFFSRLVRVISWKRLITLNNVVEVNRTNIPLIYVVSKENDLEVF